MGGRGERVHQARLARRRTQAAPKYTRLIWASAARDASKADFVAGAGSVDDDDVLIPAVSAVYAGSIV